MDDLRICNEWLVLREMRVFVLPVMLLICRVPAGSPSVCSSAHCAVQLRALPHHLLLSAAPLCLSEQQLQHVSSRTEWSTRFAVEVSSWIQKQPLRGCNAWIMGRVWVCWCQILLLALRVCGTSEEEDASCDGVFDIYFVLDRWVVNTVSNLSLYGSVRFPVVHSWSTAGPLRLGETSLLCPSILPPVFCFATIKHLTNFIKRMHIHYYYLILFLAIGLQLVHYCFYI